MLVYLLGIDKSLTKKPVQKQVSEQPHAAGAPLQCWGVGQASRQGIERVEGEGSGGVFTPPYMD
ncbi:hypothetical protein J6590_020516 [Homalodisca vitripennis]|nr:hypothetical protein J6590_020516 [Homalodisca vitripennis]